MEISFDPAKRDKTLAERGLDFLDAPLAFAGRTASAVDDRQDYGEVRIITAGYLRGRFIVLAWTQRGNTRHIISMRYGHDQEQQRWLKQLG